jgi:hypothetical protein
MDCLNDIIKENITITTINNIIQKCDNIEDYKYAKHLLFVSDIKKESVNNIKIILNHKKEKGMEYGLNRSKFEFNTHWGQRKLLLTEIQFLTNYYHLFNNTQKYVLYIGAAHGIHIPILSKFFPEINFILFDPRKFSIKETPKIKIFNKYFTNDDAIYYKNNLTNFMFICDIRTQDIGKTSDIQTNDIIIGDDMKLQMDWHIILNPIKSHLKFRLPWNTSNLNYLSGDIYLQPWTGKFSTETRLVPFDNNMKEYNSKIYDDELYYHNVINRIKYYTGYKINTKYFCHCYNCSLEITILKHYMNKILNKEYNYDNIEKISKYITYKLSKNKYKSLFDKKIKVSTKIIE